MSKEEYSFRITDHNVKSLWLLQFKVYEIRNAWVITILQFAFLLTFPVSGILGRYISYLQPFIRLIRPQSIRVYVIITLGIVAVNIVEYPQLLKEMEELIRSLS
jgi:Na+-transporting NADH:ubiquinone oxidoreductase subunit NqrD